LHLARESAKKVCGLGGFARRREDCSVILLEEVDPHRDVVGVAQFAGDLKVGTEKRRRQLGYQLLGRVSLFIEAASEVAIET